MATKATKAAEATKVAGDLEELRATLGRWQEIEGQSVAQTSAIIAKIHEKHDYLRDWLQDFEPKLYPYA